MEGQTCSLSTCLRLLLLATAYNVSQVLTCIITSWLAERIKPLQFGLGEADKHEEYD
jgi:hypothetical protein